jgi:shikimate kinase
LDGASGTHLILVGLPGSGKSTVGKAVASALDRPFMDLDAEIERRSGTTVSEIFAERGEESFRELERSVTRELREKPPMVLAPGGGWIANPGCVELLRPPAKMVYLSTNPAKAVRRMGSKIRKRPLLAVSDPVAGLKKLLTVREKLYLQADHTVSVDSMAFRAIVERIVALA